jgi:hypothetical protein
MTNAILVLDDGQGFILAKSVNSPSMPLGLAASAVLASRAGGLRHKTPENQIKLHFCRLNCQKYT